MPRRKRHTHEVPTVPARVLPNRAIEVGVDRPPPGPPPSPGPRWMMDVWQVCPSCAGAGCERCRLRGKLRGVVPLPLSIRPDVLT